MEYSYLMVQLMPVYLPTGQELSPLPFYPHPQKINRCRSLHLDIHNLLKNERVIQPTHLLTGLRITPGTGAGVGEMVSSLVIYKTCH
jgi:hypothetical protein